MFDFRLPHELKKRKIKNPFAMDIEPHETFLDSLAKKKEEQFGLSEKKFETPLSKNILRGFLIFVFGLLSFLLARTIQFQVIEGKELTQLADANKFKIYQLTADRGVIYDQKGAQLIWNKPSFDLVAEKESLPVADSEKEKVLNEVAGLLKEDVTVLKAQIEENPDSEVLVAGNIDYMTLIQLEAKIGDLTGFQIRNNSVRDYRLGPTFSHLLGYTGKINSDELKAAPDMYSVFDWVGRAGLEKSYEDALRKNPGELQVEKDALGNVISQKIVSLPKSGNSLVLWLDSALQNKMKEVLQKESDALGARSAVAVAMDPKTGGILGMVSLPEFDDNLFQNSTDTKALSALLQDRNNALVNRAIAGVFPTGSTIKPFEAAGALQENIISPDKKINDDKGYITIPNPWDPSKPTIKRDWSIHGWVDMRQAIAQSCDVYFYTLGGGYGDQKGLGASNIKKYLNLFSWGEKTGIDLPGESAGYVPDKNSYPNWGLGDTYNLAIGQGYIQITPLQVVSAFSAIANGGKLLQPQMVQKIIDRDKNTVEEFAPQVIRENFIDSKNIQVAREGMRWAVTGQNSPQASSISLNNLPVAVAAKTGTAELGNEYYNNWATVFAPYDDPQIVITILLEDVKGVQAAALPVVRDILQWYFSPH